MPVTLLGIEYQQVTSVLLHPDDKSHLWSFTARQSGLTGNPSQDGFLCSPEHSKVSFELLEIFSAAQKSLPLQGAGNRSEVALPGFNCRWQKRKDSYRQTTKILLNDE